MNKIEGARAFVRSRHGVYKEVDVYSRGEQKYVPYGKGFVRLVHLWGAEWGTSHPYVKVIELTGVE